MEKWGRIIEISNFPCFSNCHTPLIRQEARNKSSVPPKMEAIRRFKDGDTRARVMKPVKEQNGTCKSWEHVLDNYRLSWRHDMQLVCRHRTKRINFIDEATKSGPGWTRALVIGTTLGFTKYIDRERGGLPRSQKRTKKKGGKKKSVSVYIYIFEIGEKWRDKEENKRRGTSESGGRIRGAGLKTLTKLLNTRVCSALFIFARWNLGWEGEKWERRKDEGVEREGGCINANARTSKGKEIRGKCVCVCVWRQTRNSVEEICGFAFTG